MIDIDKFLACLFVGIFSLSFLHLIVVHTSRKDSERTDNAALGYKRKLFVKDIKGTTHVKDIFGFDYDYFLVIGPIVVTVAIYLYLADLGKPNLIEKLLITYLSIVLFLYGINTMKTLFSSAFVVFVSLTLWPMYFYIDSSVSLLLPYSFLISVISYAVVYFFYRKREHGESKKSE